MFAMEHVLSELCGEEVNEQGLPPGFRFHPTDEELITFYLASKVFNGTFCGVEIAEVDLNRCEPWELPDVAKMGKKEWYFFSLRDRKYPTGLRTNRATGAGYWKATGKDREVCSSSNGALLGMKKTLVFYKGRAPRGEKTKWVMHEYRLDGDFSYRHTCKEEWVICRIFHKAAEKKSGFLQGQDYLLEADSSPTGVCLPSLMECQSQNRNAMVNNLQNQFLIQQTENDLKVSSLISSQSYHHHHLFPINGLFQTSTILSPMANANNTSQSQSQSMLFKSFLSHQDFTLKEQITSENTIPKHCKTEANFSHFQLPDSAAAADNNNNFSSNCWMDKIQPNPYQNPLVFEIDCSFPGLTQGCTTTTTTTNATGTSANDLSTSVAFNRTGFQVMWEESWPLDA